MFERRPIWGVLIGLTICISIWRISVQEPSMLAEYGYNNNINIGGSAPQMAAYYQQQQQQQHEQQLQQLQEQQQQQQPQQLYGGKHLLARKSYHDISDEEVRLAGVRYIVTQTDTANTDKAQHNNAQYTQNTYTNTAANRKHGLHLATASSSSSTSSSRNQDVLLLLLDESKNKTNSAKNLSKKNSSSHINDSSYSSVKRSGKLRLVTNEKATSFQKHSSKRYRVPYWHSDSAATATTTTTTNIFTPSQVPAVTLDRRQVTPATTTTTTTTEALQLHLPPDDFQQLIDLHNFDYIMCQPACADNIAALILVHSAPANYLKRLLIRETWGQHTLLHSTPLRLIFLLGAVANKTLQHQLQQENTMYKDMVQGNFVDDYKNMTYKHTMAFKWFIYNCDQAQILIKVDDDVFVNTPQLLKYLQQQQLATEIATGDTYDMSVSKTNASQTVHAHSNSSTGGGGVTGTFTPSTQLFRHPQHLLFCQQLVGSRVKRTYRSKWRVSSREYANRYYPPYCPGYSIIYSADVLMRLYEAAQSSKYFWIDDVHVTGTLAELQNITITSSLPYVLSSDACDSVLAGKTQLAELEFLFAWPGITEQQIHDLWELNLLQQENDDSASARARSKLKDDYQATDDSAAAQYSYEGFR